MGFTTQTFLFLFFPACMLTYLIVDRLSCLGSFGNILTRLRFKDIVLILFSFGFYMWTIGTDGFRLLAYTIMLYFIAQGLHCFKTCPKINSQKFLRWFFYGSIALLLVCLIYFKYTGFIVVTFNRVFSTQYSFGSILAPLGISFITFSAISYLADIYRQKATPGSLIDCLLYITFFPKVVSGPIVLWKDFQQQISNRKMSLDLSVDGINLIMIGFAKKILLADVFGNCLAKIGVDNLDSITILGTIVLYFLQIYYDFAGYSDIAIGLSKLFGFSFSDNFNFPYRSKSISEFWRRWHISLGAWFREYVYFPLGGSRVSKLKTLRNLAIVFALTGIWHGAGWNYIIWGAINAIAVVFERLLQNNKCYIKTPSWIKYSITMLIVMLFWQFFRFQGVGDILNMFKMLFDTTKSVYLTWQYHFDLQIIAFAVIGILGATILGSPRITAIYHKFVAKSWGYVIQEIVLILLFVLAILFMINSTYSPFIYFQY